ncbi:hypothetical protein [Streptomyces sp. NBC_00252]
MSSRPDRAGTRPAASRVRVGYQRASFIGATLVNFSVYGLNSYT